MCPSNFPQVDPEELTLVYNLRKLMKNDWVRGMQQLKPQNAVSETRC